MQNAFSWELRQVVVWCHFAGVVGFEPRASEQETEGLGLLESLAVLVEVGINFLKHLLLCFFELELGDLVLLH